MVAPAARATPNSGAAHLSISSLAGAVMPFPFIPFPPIIPAPGQDGSLVPFSPLAPLPIELAEALASLIEDIGAILFEEIVIGGLQAGANSWLGELLREGIAGGASGAAAQASGGITVDGRTITVNGERFIADTLAESMVLEMHRRNIEYLPAMRIDNVIMVAPTPINRETAETILLSHDVFDRLTPSGVYVGVFARNKTLAEGLTEIFGGHDPRTPEIHPGDTGFWWHYHPKNSGAHIWFSKV